MNKFGIKVYGHNINNIDGFDYDLNSICHDDFTYRHYRYRIINGKAFGIELNIKIKKK